MSKHSPYKPKKTNARLKLYPSQTVFQICSRPIFNTEQNSSKPLKTRKKSDSEHTEQDKVFNSYENNSAEDEHRRTIESTLIDNAVIQQKMLESKQSAQARARRAVYDIALLNDWDWMFTWTLDPKKVNRYDSDEVYRYLKPALSNLTQRKGFVYLLVPEYHKLKEGETRPAIHFHGLCKFNKIKLVRAKKKGKPRFDRHGRPVYNMSDWPYGWSTVVPLDGDKQAVTVYIAKYILKQSDKILGKYYLCSRSLVKKPDIIPLVDNFNYESFRDNEKLMTSEQSEFNLYGDVYLLSEAIKRS